MFHDVANLLWKSPRLLRLPRGHGQPVVVIPGFKISDRATIILRKFLTLLGYKVHGWGLGINHGHVKSLHEQLVAQIKKRYREYGEPIRLIGWSLGGYLAREVARDFPKGVHSVVSMGSPLIGGAKYTFAARIYQRRGIDLDAEEKMIAGRNAIPIKAPLLVIYSKEDGVVSWQACLDTNKKHKVSLLEVKSSHLGLGFHFDVYQAIAQFIAEKDSDRTLTTK